MLPQDRFDFAKLYTEAPKLDLIINTTEIFDAAVREITRAVARPVQAGSGPLAEGRWYELLSRQLLPVEVASPDSDTAYV
jgi:hypothetical protein